MDIDLDKYEYYKGNYGVVVGKQVTNIMQVDIVGHPEELPWNTLEDCEPEIVYDVCYWDTDCWEIERLLTEDQLNDWLGEHQMKKLTREELFIEAL